MCPSTTEYGTAVLTRVVQLYAPRNGALRDERQKPEKPEAEAERARQRGVQGGGANIVIAIGGKGGGGAKPNGRARGRRGTQKILNV